MTAPTVLAVLVSFVLGYGLAYFLWLQVAGLVLTARERRAAPVPARALTYYVLVPCLDEEAVIGATVENLLAFGGDTTVVVVDDGSADRTADVARSAGGDDVLLVSRTLPHARQGKGAALNHALRLVVADVRERALDPERVVVAVMDADGRLSPGTADAVSVLFDDPRTGGVQLQVRIRNRSVTGTAIQDVGFWGVSAVAQMGRNATRSVSLGGNGQFARLAALLDLPGDPWTTSLTEDLDLTVSLVARGWHTRQTARAHVEQEAPETVRALLKQRTRWAQGHMVCAARVRELWTSRRASTPAVLELTLYLLQPWALALTWSLLAPVLLVLGVGSVVREVAEHGAATGFAIGAALLVVSAVPLLHGALVYRGRAADTGLLRALWLQVAGAALTAAVWTATWRALVRIVRGATGWDKTARIGDARALVG